jgi:hypothetical protein
VWNQFNQVQRDLRNPPETTNTWTYATAAFRQANGAAANKFEFVSGQATPLRAQVVMQGTGSATGQSIIGGVGVDSTTVNSGQIMVGGGQQVAATGSSTSLTYYDGVPALGYHAINWLEYASGATLTVFGDAGTTNIIQTGMAGQMLM